jgi:hypothetical protein
VPRGPSPLAAFLLGLGPPPPEEVLRAARVAAYAYTVLPREHPALPSLRLDYLAARIRHERIRRELRPLLAAWAAAGIRVLVFKGFHLAEFVYPEPGTRFHGDVDVLIPTEAEGTAERIALALGWSLDIKPDERGLLGSHCAFSIYWPGGTTSVDVHRRIIHSGGAGSAAPDRVTTAVWRSAKPREWQGIPLWEPQPVDALLVGLVMQRAWGDRWRIKPHDPLDLRLLSDHAGVTRARLWERARELRCERTLARFLERCDPAARRLVFTPLTLGQLWWVDLRVSSERSPRGFDRLREYIRILPELPRDMARALPTVLRMRHATRSGRDLVSLLRSLTPTPAPAVASSTRTRGRTVRGIRWLTARVPFDPKGAGLVRSLAIYAALRRQGWPVHFVTGVRRDGVPGEHSWVELEKRVLVELQKGESAGAYREIFRYPPEPGQETGPVSRA